MKHFKKSFALLTLLTLMNGSQISAQDLTLESMLNLARTKNIVLDNDYKPTGYEQGNFYNNPLLLNEVPLDYDQFNITSKGELTVIKGAVINGKPTQVPFYIYLKRYGARVPIPIKANQQHIKIDISEILRYAKPDDHLVIEPVRKEDGPAKRILKILGGC